jgi:hypothetical protein
MFSYEYGPEWDKSTAMPELKTEMGRRLLTEALDLTVVLDKKNQDYSSANISKFGLQGIVVRLNDKIERLTNLIKKNGEGNFESIEDTLIDIAGYSLIGKIVSKGEWK